MKEELREARGKAIFAT